MPKDNKNPNKKRPPSMTSQFMKAVIIVGAMAYGQQFLPGNDDEAKSGTPDTTTSSAPDFHEASQMITTKDGKHIVLMDYDNFKNLLFSKAIEDITFGRDGANEIMYGKTKGGNDYAVISIGDKDPYLYEDIENSGAAYRNELIPKQPGPTIADYAKYVGMQFGPILLLIGVWIFFMRKGMGGKNTMGQSKAKMLGDDQKRVTFDDVAGVDEAKEDVEDLVKFLKHPEKYEERGLTIPRGTLMVGPPGTGKTLLARAIAGEANVPFFTMSGSEFVEMFVGVGASRVRDLFEKAKKEAPCIIFIDEIDAVGKKRGTSAGNGNDEREQTLNQLLVEMDGFEGSNVILIAATNRADVLDDALLRPGRFTRQVTVDLPDAKGREQILKVHMRNVPNLSPDINTTSIALGTEGFSGADLANLVNEAGFFAFKANKKMVDLKDFIAARNKVIMGAELKSRVISEKEREMTAYHEAGHTVIARHEEGNDPVQMISIMPRGKSLGVTVTLPTGDRLSISEKELKARLAMLYGGRVAEEKKFGVENVSTGAQNDIERITDMARQMVTKWGFSKNEKLGRLNYSTERSNPFGQSGGSSSHELSQATLEIIESEIHRVAGEREKRAEEILIEHKDEWENIAQALIKYGELVEDEIDMAARGEELPDREPVNQSKKDDDDNQPPPPKTAAFLALPPPSGMNGP